MEILDFLLIPSSISIISVIKYNLAQQTYISIEIFSENMFIVRMLLSKLIFRVNLLMLDITKIVFYTLKEQLERNFSCV